jgi:hypothetical protein
MASEWVELDQIRVGKIQVNLAIATSIQRLSDTVTRIRFSAANPDAHLDVSESVPAIMAALRKLQDANRT